MSHGSCTGSGGCKCDRGYVGYHCEHRCDPAVDCNGNGRCSVTGRCVCDPCYDGAGCKLKCAGRGACVANACKCDSCYVGTYCHSECSGHGSCRNGTCDCDWRWRGQFCEIPGCPNDCCGNGICNGALHTCFCNPGWGEVDCCSTDCPGEPNCFGRGDCVTVGSTPVCKNCSKGWMGPACNDPCTHGVQTPMDSGVCKCDPCWAGKGCDALCMDRGTCRNGTCVCDPLLGWRGSVCEIPGCPGIGSDCSGHGDCNGAKHECTCFNGWTGVGCHIPDCPGAPNCFNRGYCDSTVDPPICQNCSRGWMGSACADPCKFGEQTPMDSGNCTCLPGYTGVGYDSECSEHGNVINGRCRCKDGWRGPVCNIPGCPGEEKNCSGHGTCNSATHICTCQLGWTGKGCEIPDCPGSPNCFNRGYCNATTDPPKCQNCSVGWMGPACKDPCTHGIQVPMDGGNCVCEAGYSGAGCNSECSEHGKIVGNGTCECHPGWWGAVCMIQGCPSVGTDCSGHGECNSATQTCVCENGWTRAGCSVPDCPGNPNCAGRGHCNSEFDPPRCTNCSQGWMGPACADLCVHGTQVPMDSGNCVCEPCYSGRGCNAECSGHGACVNGKCSCYFLDGWKGSLCELPGCPGLNGKDCSGHGQCDSAKRKCICDPGWTGAGCHEPDCPGTPNCFDRGHCNTTDRLTPECTDCTRGWMGPACNDPCVHGHPENGVCKCDPCYTHQGCDSECSGNGECIEGQRCRCYSVPGNAHSGPNCELPVCPGDDGNCNGKGFCNLKLQRCECYAGWAGHACDEPDCPGTPRCSGHGECSQALPRRCNCHRSWAGETCEVPCVNGVNYGNTSGCMCGPCYAGVGCNLECAGNGKCVTGQCQCDVQKGFKGDVCHLPSCPGWPLDCSGHGTCNKATLTCQCDPGWVSTWCGVPDCPGDPDCNGHGICFPPTKKGKQPKCNCTQGWMGEACELPCTHGQVTADYVCNCDPCYGGDGCSLLCSNRSNICANGSCDCGFDGWRGNACERKGCPGYGRDCSGHGKCLIASQTCICDSGWEGLGCEKPDCPGDPDCNGRGLCVEADVPYCGECDRGWIGQACDVPCTNGTQSQDNTELCVCNACFSGVNCDLLCSGRENASCVDGLCYCGFEGWRGQLCEKKGCPGLYNKDCSGYGTCNSATQTCECEAGWSGQGCERELCPGTPECSGHGVCNATDPPSCICDAGWMGFACEAKCVNGSAILDQTGNSFVCLCDDCFGGADCELECAGHGTCKNGTCDCGFEGWRGRTCETKRCPGWGSDCTAHGSCISSLGQCYCRPGWIGRGCEVPQCPGGGNCSGHGVCDGIHHDPPVCTLCDESYMGSGCELRCLNGSRNTTNGGDICLCDACHTGLECDSECDGHGQCVGGVCSCNKGWRGNKCETVGCPGVGVDCSGHGVCLAVNQECDCYTGWKGEGCDIPDCPGTPDCSGLGTCLGTTDPPRCVNCTKNTMGSACDLPCYNGRESPPHSSICKCDPCYTGRACNVKCSTHGQCVNNTVCLCDSGWQGEYCQNVDCPGNPDCDNRGACVLPPGASKSVCLCNQGFDGQDCKNLVCPGEPMCSNRGNCTLINNRPTCVCNHGFDGSACERCLPRFAGSDCQTCATNYIGWKLGCSVFCVHGDGTGPNQAICECHDNSSLGHWNGSSCDRCTEGWALPTCTSCDAAHVGANCNINCVTAHGQYRDPRDGDWEREPVEPILNCLSRDDDGSIRAWFGYHNKNLHNVYLKVGPDNEFTRPSLNLIPGGIEGFVRKQTTKGGESNFVPLLSKSFGQPTKFLSGKHENVFSVRLDDPDPIVWLLAYPISNKRFVVIVSQSMLTSRQCTKQVNSSSSENTDVLKCECRDGYWGTACQYDCPGGGANPCFGHGSCNKTTGKCLCDPNWRGNSTCDVCSPGWYGNDCSVVIQTPNNRTATAFAHGFIVSLDGIGYRFLGKGEYTLLEVPSLDFEIQVKMTSCYSRSSCFNALAIRLEKQSLMVHSRLTISGDPFVFVNGKESPGLKTSIVGSVYQRRARRSVLVKTNGENAIYLERISRLRFSLTSNFGAELSIRIYDRYMDVNLRMWNESYCKNSSGIWGNCNSDVLDDLNSHTGGSIAWTNVSQAYIHNVFSRSWMVKPINSLFVYDLYPHHEKRLSHGGGYSLFFNNTGAQTKGIYSFSSSDISVEVMIRLQSNAGTLFSYAAGGTLAVSFSGTIKLHYEGTKLDTLAALEVGKWNQIALVWSKTSRILQFFHLSSDGRVRSRNFPVAAQLNIFEPGGVLALGYWLSSPTGSGLPPDQPFIGEIDELRIWNRKLDPFSVSANFKRNVGCKELYLASLWKFDEGQGTVAYDCVSMAHISFSSLLWTPPSWLVSTADIPLPSDVNELYRYAHQQSSTLKESERNCFNLIFSLPFKSCSALNEASLWFYYTSCVNAVTISGQTELAYWPVLSLADYCQKVSASSTWDAQQLCNALPSANFPDWVGMDCQSHCTFGKPGADKRCRCTSGFYGANCSSECPGGYENQCSGFSTCKSSTGKCICPVNANSSADCSLCSPGWSGRDCSVAIMKDTNATSKPHCQVFGAAHYTTFDGVSYTFNSYGEFYALNTENFVVQVRQMPCAISTFCVSALAVRAGSTNVTLHAQYNSNGFPLIWINRTLTDIKQINWHDGSFSQVSPESFMVANNITENQDSSFITIKFWKRQISFELTTKPLFCQATSGLCASCDANARNDFMTADGNVLWNSTLTQHNIINQLTKRYGVQDSNSMFVYQFNNYMERRTISSGGFCLAFNGTVATASLLSDTITNNTDLTLQFFLQVRSMGGTVLSYSTTTTFAVVNDATVKIYIAGNVYDTKVSLTLSKWYQLSLVYLRSKGVLIYHHTDASNIFLTRKFFVGPNILFPGGTLWLGQWHVTQTQIQGLPLEPFIGSIDNMRIWKIALDDVTTKQSFSSHISVQTNGLESMWLFDEGQGIVAKNSLKDGEGIQLSAVASRRPSWRLSYYTQRQPVIAKLPQTGSYDTKLQMLARQTCSRLFYDNTLQLQCSTSTGTFALQYYYLMCLQDIWTSSDNSTAFVALSTYSNYCQRKSRFPVYPIRHLCHEVTNSPWIGPNCEVRCLFGYADVDNNSICVCKRGYWGKECDSMCPGGATTPCNNHGRCNVTTGRCKCELNWRGNSDCTACSPEWRGPDCSIAVTLTREPTCSGFTGGHFLTFDGAQFNFFGLGEFKLISSPQFEFQFRQVSCYDGRSRCLNSIALHFPGSAKLEFHAPYKDGDLPVIWQNGKLVIISSISKQAVSGITIDQTSTSTYTIKNAVLGINILVRVMGRELSFATNMTRHLCNTSHSACGSCDGKTENDLETGQASLEEKWRVQEEQSLFQHKFDIYEEKPIPTGAEYALVFRGVGVSSDLLPDIFAGSHISIEMLFKFKAGQTSGTLFSYSKYTTFIMFVELTIKIRVRSNIWDTGVTPGFSDWNQITLVYHRTTGALYVFYISSEGVVTTKTRKIVSGLFTKSGTIAIGQWIPGAEDGALPRTKSFIGYIDEVRVWNRDFDLSAVKRNWKVNVQNYASHIAILWKFNEGAGTTIHDSASSVSLYIPADINAPQWIYSTADIDTVPISSTIFFPIVALKEAAEQWCSAHVITSPVGRSCVVMGSGSSNYFFRACLRVIASQNTVSAGVRVVVTFSDTCRISLQKTYWPAQKLCHDPAFIKSNLVSWTGPNCDVRCVYGRPHPTNGGSCLCNAGFWGRNCEYSCIGGSANVCSGKGTCSPHTGLCICNERWRRKNDCSKCTEGFYGADCSVVLSPAWHQKGVISISGTGHYVTLDGAKIVFRETGEFTVFVSQRLNVNIQVRQVQQGDSVRVRCVAVRVQSTVISIHSSISMTSQVIVVIGGVQVSPREKHLIGNSGFVFSRSSENSYLITGPHGFSLLINHRGVSLDVQLTMDKSLCSDSCGVLGNCRKRSGYKSIARQCSSSFLDSYRVSLITQNIINTYIKSWSVAKNDSMFSSVLKISKEPFDITGGGSCLFFNGTSIVSPSLANILFGNYLAVQFFIKEKLANSSVGTVISFAGNHIFAMIINGTIKIHFGLKVFDTKLVIQKEKWNHITLVYRRVSGVLQLYVTNVVGIVQARVFDIGVGAFPITGTLAVALYQVTSVSKTIPGFVGWIDELSVWNKRFDPIMVQQSWRVNVQATEPGIATLWKFNEGHGYVVHSLVGSVNIFLPRPPWKSPKWQPSSVNVSLGDVSAATFPNDTFKNHTEELCYKLIASGPLHGQCEGVTGNTNFYYQSCISDIVASGSLDSAVVSTFSMAFECKAALNLSGLPGKELCNILPSGRFGNWIGKNCSNRCVFGQYRHGSCQCDDGYWGRDCSKECPGGADNPCDLHGACDVDTGKCTCDLKWNGNEECSRCSEGWFGRFCSIAYVAPPKPAKNKTVSARKVCSVTENGHVAGFDGSFFSFAAVGEFVMINSTNVQTQIRQVPCESSSVCINAFGLKIQDLHISLHAPYEKNEKPIVHVDGQNFYSSSKPTDAMRQLNVSMLPLSSSSYRLTASDYLSIKASFYDRYVILESTVTNNFCKKISGLCGSCAVAVAPGQNTTQTNGSSITPEKDITTVLVGITTGDVVDGNLDQYIKDKLSVSTKDKSSVIVIDEVQRKETRVVYGGGHTLHFNFSVVATKSVVNLFSSDEITIEFLVKSCNPIVCGGPIMSYASSVAFIISNHITVKVIVGMQVYDSRLPTESDKWNQISVVIVRSTLKMFVYVVSSSGLVRSSAFELKVIPFIDGGTLAVGLWQPPSGSQTIQPANVFIGYVDEMRVWKKMHDYALLKQIWGSNIQPGTPSLTGLWKFDEGEGGTVTDLVNGNNFIFPKYPMKAPTWVFSDAPITVVTKSKHSKVNKTLRTMARNECFKFLYTGPIYKNCWKLGNVTLGFYYSACVDTVVSSGIVSQSMDVVVAVADYCMAALEVDSWPARPLCNQFPEQRFPNWIGLECTTPCIFGRASKQNIDVCVCDSGYYGMNCSGICPGGAQNTCNKHGLCNLKTGKCHCEINWRGDEACTTCSNGWEENDCSIAKSVLPSSAQREGTGSVSIDGYFTTLDGANYVLQLIGEYYLLRSIHVDVVVQVRFVNCFKESSCVNSVALRSRSHYLVIRGPYTTDTNTVVWVDNKPVDIEQTVIDSATYGFSIVKASKALYVVKGHSDSLVLKIRVYSLYLNVNVRASNLVCKDSYGLVGACNRKFLEQHIPSEPCSGMPLFSRHRRDANPENRADSNMKTQDLITSFSTKLTVRECNSLFNYSYEAMSEHRSANAGYGLFFRQAAVLSQPISYALSGRDFSIQMMLKTVQFGVVLSYTKVKTFFVTNAGGNFSIYFGNNVFHTKIEAELNTWCQINLVFNRLTGTLQFYYFKSGGLVQRIDIQIGVDYFAPKGLLALAGWQPSRDGSGIQPTAFFVGFIDEVRIWTRSFHPAVILETWNRRVAVQTSDLAHMWIFAEGGGDLTRDVVANAKLRLGTKPWRSPEWYLSDLKLQGPFYKKSPSYTFGRKDLETKANTFCDDVLQSGQFKTGCQNLGPGVFEFYFRSCLQRISVTGSLYKSLDVIIAYADYCQVVNKLPTWPAKLLCNDFPGEGFPDWFGPECNKKCIFGAKIPSDSCVCQRGYWGEDCSKVCPGGVSSPCNDHGTCDHVTGMCECHANWRGNDCNQCSPNWTGSDCSVAMIFLPYREVSVAVSFQGANYVTFDGCSFSFVAVGMFHVIQSHTVDFAVQVRQVPCHLQSVCINAIAARMSETNITFHAPYKVGNTPVIWVNKMVIYLTGHVRKLDSPDEDIYLQLDSTGYYTITWKDKIVISIRVDGKYLSFQLNIDTSYCYNSVGLLGSCDGNPHNDFGTGAGLVTPLANTTQLNINRESAVAYRVNISDSLFILDYKKYHETSVPTGSGYALWFNKTGASSSRLFNSFPERSNITMEILFKPYRLGGTVLSFVTETTFAITVNNTIVIHYGTDNFHTDVNVDVGDWCQVSLVWYYRTRTLEFYHFSMNGNLQRRTFTMSANIFSSGGILLLGQWDPSPGDTEFRTEVSFVGVIDELRVWKRAFDPVLIQQNWRMNVLPSYPDLSALWKCNEGEGNVVLNLVTNEHIFIPQKPWPEPEWVYSDADVNTNFTSSKKPFELLFSKKQLQKTAISLCFELFYKGPLNTHCGRLSAERDFSYLVCLKDIAAKGVVSAAITTVTTFSDHCQSALNLTTWPAQKLCNKFPGIRFPFWIGDNCDIRCIFGYSVIGESSKCVCDKGYWSNDCSKICPGGILNTCNSHGRCEKETGQCICEVNWRGDNNCSSCTVGWRGTNCEFVVSKLPSKTVFLASVGNFGYLRTFFGASFFHRSYGEFYLIRTLAANFRVQIRKAPCEYQNTSVALCTTAIAFGYKNITAAIRAPISNRHTNVMPIVWLNEKVVRVDHVTQLSVHFTMVRVSSVRYHINGADGIKFVLNVGLSLGVQIQLPREYCENATGLLGPCKKYEFGPNGTNINNLIEKMTSSSGVTIYESLFVYKFLSYYEHRSITGGGFNLLFHDSLVRSQPMHLARINVLTIEILVKSHEYGGVILSYSHKKTFAIINERSIKIVYGEKVLDTGFGNEIGKWNQIVLVYKWFIGVLQVYHFSSSGHMSIRALQLDNDVFADGGVLNLGQWQSSLVQGVPPSSYFIGEIDELRIWKRRSNVDLLRAIWQTNVRVGMYPDLLHLWKFNQAEGSVIKDLVSDSHLYVVKFREPLWAFSDANIPTLNTDNIGFGGLSAVLRTESHCLSLILTGTLFSNCEKLGVQVAQFYYNVCLSDVAVSKELSWAVYSVVSYADYCQVELGLTLWPAKQLCHHFPDLRFPNWIGSRCEIPCVFGYAVPALNASERVVCACEKGYWGNDCSNLCPGGLWNVCNGHGSCNPVNGTCLCEPHWRGNTTGGDGTERPACSVCTHGWIGSDCSISTELSFQSRTGPSIGVAFGDPHFTAAAGLSYHFAVPGSFELFIADQLKIQAVQVPCRNKLSCRRIKEIALEATKVAISVRFTNGTELQATIVDGGKEVSSFMENSREWRSAGESLRYRWLSLSILELTTPGNIKINLLFYDGKIGFAIEVPQSKRNKTLGLCGYQGTKLLENSPVDEANKTAVIPGVSQGDVDQIFGLQLKLKEKKSILDTIGEIHFTGASYMLEFVNSWMVFKGGPTLPDLTEFTLKVWVCLVTEHSDVSRLCVAANQTVDSEHVIMLGKVAVISISMQTSTLALIYDNGVNIYWSNQKFNTGIMLRVGVWAHVALTWRNNDGRMQVLVNSGDVSNSSTQYSIQTWKHFSFSGSIALGRYLHESSFIEEFDMIGGLDELRVWQYAKNAREIEKLRTRKFDYYIPGLVLLLPLDEGYGLKAEASFYHPIAVTPSNVDRNPNGSILAPATFHAQPEQTYPTWRPSGVPLTPLTNYTLRFSNSSLKFEAEKTCYKWFYGPPLRKYCSNIMTSQALFYYESCLADIANSERIESYKLSVSLFALYCHKLLDVEPCLLHGTHDAFPQCGNEVDEVITVQVIIIICTAVAVLVFSCCIICFVIVIVGRRKKKERRRQTKRSGYVSEPDKDKAYTLGSADDESFSDEVSDHHAGIFRGSFINTSDEQDGTETRPKALASFGFEMEEEEPTAKREPKSLSDPRRIAEISLLNSPAALVADKFAEYSGITHYGLTVDDDYEDIEESAF